MSRKKKTPTAPAKVHLLTDLEQVKVLADPLRLRILEPLCEAARTTKQVAEILGEKPTKLYHHIDALERVGLIRLESTRQKRGTLEKYYRAVATSFRADPELFSSTSCAPESWAAMGATVLENAVTELRGLAPPDPSESPEKAIFAGVRIRARAADVAALQEKVESWIEEATSIECEEEDEEVDYRLAVAFYPVKPIRSGGS